MNYLYAILEAEARIAAIAVGLDPGLGILHADQRSRDSLACDLMEPLRPEVDRWVLNLLRERTFSVHDFAETRQGVCRVLPPLTHLLAETGPTWARAVAPLAERIARQLFDGWNDDIKNRSKPLSTPLTQSRRSAGRDSVRRHPQRMTSNIPSMPQACRMCGLILGKSGRIYCDDCLLVARQDVAKPWSRSGLRTLANLRTEGYDPAHGGRAAKRRGRRIGRLNREATRWELEHENSQDETYFKRNVLPRLRRVSLRGMAEATGLTLGYCSFVRRGLRLPHPRHWEALRRVIEAVSTSQFVRPPSDCPSAPSTSGPPSRDHGHSLGFLGHRQGG